MRMRRRKRGSSGLSGPVAVMVIGVERRRQEPRLRALHTKMGSTLLGRKEERREGRTGGRWAGSRRKSLVALSLLPLKDVTPPRSDPTARCVFVTCLVTTDDFLTIWKGKNSCFSRHGEGGFVGKKPPPDGPVVLLRLMMSELSPSVLLTGLNTWVIAESFHKIVIT